MQAMVMSDAYYDQVIYQVLNIDLMQLVLAPYLNRATVYLNNAMVENRVALTLLGRDDDNNLIQFVLYRSTAVQTIAVNRLSFDYFVVVVDYFVACVLLICKC